MNRVLIDRRSSRERRSRSGRHAPAGHRASPRRSWLPLVLLAALVLALALAGCRPRNEARSSSTSAADAPEPVRIELESPPAVGVVPVAVYVLDESAGVSGATVQVTGDMTHAGMTPVEVDAVEVEPGLYRADTFAFSMAGDWIVTAEVQYPEGRVIIAEVQLNVPAR